MFGGSKYKNHKQSYSCMWGYDGIWNQKQGKLCNLDFSHLCNLSKATEESEFELPPVGNDSKVSNIKESEFELFSAVFDVPVDMNDTVKDASNNTEESEFELPPVGNDSKMSNIKESEFELFSAVDDTSDDLLTFHVNFEGLQAISSEEIELEIIFKRYKCNSINIA